MSLNNSCTVIAVSTHSRLKAAGRPPESGRRVYQGFNTQPPKGGWARVCSISSGVDGFNTQPPKGGWFRIDNHAPPRPQVSTHSRLKAAGHIAINDTLNKLRFQHTAA